MHVAFGTLAVGKSQIHHASYQVLVCSPLLGAGLVPIGGLVRNVARIKLGYYPLPHAEGLRLRKLLVFEDGASAADPCAGTGAALHQLTEGAEVEKHGVELDAGRASAASASGIATVHGNLFDTIGKSESFSFLYLNPPYDSEMGSAGNKRMEYLFLDHTFRIPQSPCWPATSPTCASSGDRSGSRAVRSGGLVRRPQANPWRALRSQPLPTGGDGLAEPDAGLERR
jgi:hypothetical protein